LAKRRKRRGPGRPPKKRGLKPETIRAILIVACFALAIISIMGYWEGSGALGNFSRSVTGSIFGWGSFLAPVLLIFIAIALGWGEKLELRFLNYLGITILVLSLVGIFQLPVATEGSVVIEQGRGGGFIGYLVGNGMVSGTGIVAAWIILIALLFIGFLLTFNISFKALWEKIKNLKTSGQQLFMKLKPEPKVKVKTIENGQFKTKDIDEVDNDTSEAAAEKENTEADEVGDDIAVTKNTEPSGETEAQLVKKDPNWKYPSLSLLSGAFSKPTSGDIQAKANTIQKTLSNFGIEVEMSDVNVGPTVTQYTLKPLEGVKLSRILALQNDLALSLAAHPVRIEAPIPGKSLVGIEIPNEGIALVRLRELLASPEFSENKKALSMPLGRDVAGNPIIVDMAKMPHMLIAGATGSGKSVCLNSLLISLLYHNTPADLKLILVDPKRVEMTPFNDIPHLLTPVLTDVNKTINALKWSVAEMDRRYKLLQEAGKANIKSYNSSLKLSRLPYIVIAIDELADLMTVAAGDVEGAIVRLAQMARAVGIHLMVATQRPSVNVITGLIKANITTRLAFNVASQIDSRTIIDMQGAEKLLGNGDMLFINAETSKPKRIQGALIEEPEIRRVTDFIKKQGSPDYDEGVPEKDGRKDNGDLPGLAGSGDQDVDDDLFAEARAEVIRMGKGSASLLQRRLRIGYARAARLLDLLEEKGVVGPPDGSKPREVLVAAEKVAAAEN
jgi:DNA segregation ATPase FtsK/SpoIIIE, S-DNA-T family